MNERPGETGPLVRFPSQVGLRFVLCRPRPANRRAARLTSALLVGDAKAALAVVAVANLLHVARLTDGLERGLELRLANAQLGGQVVTGELGLLQLASRPQHLVRGDRLCH